MKNEILKYLKTRGLGTLATVNENGKPEAAYVAISEDDNLKLFFGTSNQTRKYKNLQKNPTVAIVIADFEGEIQYEGEAHEITDADYCQQVEERHVAKVPASQKFADDPSQTYFEVIPSWIRFIVHGEADKITEMTEF